MPASLTESRIATLLAPYLDASFALPTQVVASPVPTAALTDVLPRLSAFLDLLLRWNARTNLTAVRDPERIVERHFGESLFGARVLAHTLPAADLPSHTLLDFGSGAGFPGIPIQLLLPSIRVTLAESQGKKASFLREVVRTLALPTEVWAARVEDLPATRTFTVVTMRAVDRHEDMLPLAIVRLQPNGYLLELAASTAGNPPGSLEVVTSLPLPGPDGGILRLYQGHP